MNHAWIRRSPTRSERFTTGFVTLATALATGTVAWYLTRTLLSRDPISLRPEEGADPAFPRGRSRLAPPGGERE